MDLDKMRQYPLRVLGSDNKISWDGGSITIFPQFYPLRILDDMWRGVTVVFAIPSLGIDSLGWWQNLSFLTDLGPVYAVWILESCRPASRWTLACLATTATFAAQFIGIGTVGPIFYFLCFVLGPRARDLAHRPNRQLDPSKFALLLPLILSLHTLEIFGAYFSPDPITRHYWVWAWQMSPLWIGVANFLSARAIGSWFRNSRLASPALLLQVLCIISAVVWLSTLLFSPYPLADIFLPTRARQTDDFMHIRRAFQFDQVSSFTASFLWLAYLLLDMYSAGP
ncbi:e4b63ad3-5a7e-4741-a663-b6a2f33bb911 [Thermothielavioides terrestris]|uniref:E4b63ad3-5a7e-4741-a663-b6a2f33bb911 n=1 Tax=Thermothielavioides terrestris TaxID=2587410 RepID=A0A3S4AN27_9PEZI|nr:e4b63ad3-5a7e-4741-a663-b6a2f33bb911 [Thermothielavioides terrestris]